MSQKPEYYSVLGVEKGAALEDIKKAYQRAAMRNHPDRMHGKSDAEKETARQKFQEIEEAYKILSDDNKRSTYDSYGHDGLARLASGQSAGTGRSFTDLAGPSTKRTVDVDEAFSYFDRGGSAAIPTDGQRVDRAAAAEERRRAREARRTGGSVSGVDSLSVNVPPSDPVGRPAKVDKPAPAPQPAAKSETGFDFKDAARDVRGAQDKISRLSRGGFVEVPLDTLERFRDNVQEMLDVIDAAIARSRRGGPRP